MGGEGKVLMGGMSAINNFIRMVNKQCSYGTSENVFFFNLTTLFTNDLFHTAIQQYAAHIQSSMI